MELHVQVYCYIFTVVSMKLNNNDYNGDKKYLKDHFSVNFKNFVSYQNLNHDKVCRKLRNLLFISINYIMCFY